MIIAIFGVVHKYGQPGKYLVRLDLHPLTQQRRQSGILYLIVQITSICMYVCIQYCIHKYVCSQIHRYKLVCCCCFGFASVIFVIFSLPFPFYIYIVHNSLLHNPNNNPKRNPNLNRIVSDRIVLGSRTPFRERERERANERGEDVDGQGEQRVGV